MIVQSVVGVQLSTAACVSQEALPQGSSKQHSGQTKGRWLFHATYCLSFQLPAPVMLIVIINQAFIYPKCARTLLKASTPSCFKKKSRYANITLPLIWKSIFVGVCVRACVVQLQKKKQKNRAFCVFASVAPVASAMQQPLQGESWFPHAERDVLLRCVTFIVALLSCDHNLLNESVYLHMR